jgi:hypothetical protein
VWARGDLDIVLMNIAGREMEIRGLMEGLQRPDERRCSFDHFHSEEIVSVQRCYSLLP